MSKIKSHIHWQLLRKAATNKLDAQEAKTFQQWLAQDEANRIYFEKARNYYVEHDIDYPDYEPAYKEFIQNVVQPGSIKRYAILKLAAVFIVLICSGYFIFKSGLFTTNEILDVQEFSSITPTMSGEIELVLSDGRQLLLDDKQEVSIPELSGNIKKVENTIDYRSFKLAKVEVPMPNSIKTPKGKTMKVILSDSTVVWLNAQSSLNYLVPFHKNERRVNVEGEAYFEVKRNENAPFIVESAGSEISVLGTKFNVNAYKKEEGVYTTLIEGSVKVTDLQSGNNVLLKPSEQAVINPDKSINISLVNPNRVLDWKNGLFMFENEKLSGIFEELGRWYNIKYEFDNDLVANERFSGYLERDNELNILLELFEETKEIKFRMKNDLLIVGEHKNN